MNSINPLVITTFSQIQESLTWFVCSDTNQSDYNNYITFIYIYINVVEQLTVFGDIDHEEASKLQGGSEIIRRQGSSKDR